jgi:hypothetical protein
MGHCYVVDVLLCDRCGCQRCLQAGTEQHLFITVQNVLGHKWQLQRLI